MTGPNASIIERFHCTLAEVDLLYLCRLWQQPKVIHCAVIIHHLPGSHRQTCSHVLLVPRVDTAEGRFWVTEVDGHSHEDIHHPFIWHVAVVGRLCPANDGKPSNSSVARTSWSKLEGNNYMALFELLVWPHEVESWFHSWYRGRVETLDAKYNLMFR